MNNGNNSLLCENWVILLLPFLEQKNLRSSFDLTKPIPDSANATARSAQLSFMLCPTDSYNRAPFMGSASGQTNQMGDNWARGNYAANASLGYMISDSGQGAGSGWNKRFVQGVMGANDSLRVEDIKDGASSTMLVLELRAGLIPQDTRGIWAMSGGCPSACWAHGYTSDANGPNCMQTLGDDPRACGEIQTAAGGATALIALGMSCWNGSGPDWQQGSRSLHNSGVTVCFADGSVHFINDLVQRGTGGSPPACLGVWDKLNLSNDNQPIDSSTF